MSFNKSYFKQFGEDAEKEVKDFEARSESKKIKFKKCDHRQAKMDGNFLRCACGAAWSGAGMHKLIKAIKEQHGRFEEKTS